jgi:hypothetical protein
MRKLTVLLLLVLAAATTARAAEPAVTAFVGVTVVPADRNRTIPDQTVVVKGGRIAALGAASKVKVPAGATTVDGKGKFLMPGIAEMHGHLPGGPLFVEEVSSLLFKLFLANGVTTVRGMQGAPEQIPMREKIKRGELLGPQIFLFSPPMSGQNTPTPEQGVTRVKQSKEAGFDGIKIQEGLSLETYQAIARTARELKMPFGGHVPNNVGLERALAAGQRNVEHLDGYVEALVPDPDATRDRKEGNVVYGGIMGGHWPALDQIDLGRVGRLVAATRRARAMVTPTMVVWRTLFGDAETGKLIRLPELRYVSPDTMEQWGREQKERDKKAAPVERLRKLMAARKEVLKALAAAGGSIMFGADAPQRFSVPGFSLRHEAAALIEAGLTPWQVVEAATVAPARYLGLEKDFGTVAVGKRADLILADGDPLEDVDNVFRSSGVMASGRWLARAELDAMLEEIARDMRFPPAAEVKDAPIPAAEVKAVAGKYRAASAGEHTFSITSTDGALIGVPSIRPDVRLRLRAQGDGSYVVLEQKAFVSFERKDGRATRMTVRKDGVRQTWERVAD